MKRTDANGMTQLLSDQQSDEIQYERVSFLGGTLDNGETIDVSIGYRRSLDFDAKDNPGQDFAAVRGEDNGFIVGVVADGVSQSFYGDLAAYHLSDRLVKLLWRARKSPPTGDQLEKKLKELESSIAAKYVENYPIPDDLAPLHKESLEDKRSKGSQTVFAAFVLNASRKRLHLYQVGDVDAIVHYPDKSPDPIKAPPKGRWSSAGKSEMRLLLSTYEADEGTSGIVIKSDGAGKEWGFGKTVFSRSTFELLSEKRAGLDDLSFVAARWGTWQEGHETETERPLPPKQVSPPRRKKTETLQDMKRYDPAYSPRTTLPGKERHALDRDSRVARGGRERGMTVRSGRRMRLGHVPLVAAAIVSCTLIAVLLVLVMALLKPGRGEPPVGKNNNYSMNIAQGSLVVSPPGVLKNDTDPEGKDLRVDERFRAPTNGMGKVKLNSNGSFEYWPNPGFIGDDSFKYTVLDPRGNKDTAKVTIKVRPPNSWWQRLRDISGGRQ